MQITVILAVFIALLIGQTITDPEMADIAPWFSYFTDRDTLLVMAGSLMMVWSLMQMTSKMFKMRLERSEVPDLASLRLPGRIDMLMHFLIVITFGLQITLGGWGRMVYVRWELQRFVLADEVIILLPFLLMLCIKWYCLYPINRFIREYIVTGQLVEGLPARPVWSRRQYMVFQIRHGLLILLVPLLLIFAFKDITDQVIDKWFSTVVAINGIDMAVIEELIAGLGAGLIFLVSPLILKYVWVTRPLPDGPLRDKLDEFCKRIKLGYRDILLWDTYSAVANAAVMGLLKPLRFVMLSDNLIENMSDEQIEAVFGHEAGHVKHHHILFLVLFVIASSSVGVLLIQFAVLFLNGDITGRPYMQGYGEWILHGFVLLMVAGWFLLFGYVSRRFEWQADIHAAESVDPNSQESLKRFNHLGQHGAYVMGSTLQRIALLNGVSVESKSWRHSSIRVRMELLRQLAIKPGRLRRFHRQVIMIKSLILLALVISIIGWSVINKYFPESM